MLNENLNLNINSVLALNYLHIWAAGMFYSYQMDIDAEELFALT